MLPVSYPTLLQIDIKDRHGTNIQTMTLEIYVSLCFPSPLLALWLETFILKYIFEINFVIRILETIPHRNTNNF